MSDDLEEIDRHIEVLSSRWPKPYRQLEDAMVTRSLLVASQIAHHRETTAAYGMAIRKQERIEEAERECAALKARLSAVEEECADLIAGKEYQAMQRTLGEVNSRLSVASELLDRWHTAYHEKYRDSLLECCDDDTSTFLYSTKRSDAPCDHVWVNASNFEPGPNEQCVKCDALRAADSADEVQS